jgi:PPK2 family polyphosphate:nucleotide phosphotransferase
LSTETEAFKAPMGKTISLKNYDPKWKPKWAKNCPDKKALKKEASKIIDKNKNELIEKQQLLWASETYALLIILQGMDAAGKDSTIKNVMSGVNPQGCEVTAFKTPSDEEQNHDFLWRYAKRLPERGRIGIFNRSYYEDVLIVKVRPEVFEKQKLPSRDEGKQFWSHRYEDINAFERHLVRNGTIVLKFFLHISKEEQKRRLLKRLEDPEKYWKFSLTDIAERSKWDKYVQAYEEMLNETSSNHAPWYIIPSDKKWVTHILVSEIIVDHIQKLNLYYPSMDSQKKEALANAKAELEKE